MKPSIRQRWQQGARNLKKEVMALYFASRDPRVPWYAKVWIALVVAYALSPIDLVPDFIPVLGYLDDLVLIPLGVWLALKMIPEPIMSECRARAEEQINSGKPTSRWGAVLIILIWLISITLIALLILKVARK